MLLASSSENTTILVRKTLVQPREMKTQSIKFRNLTTIAAALLLSACDLPYSGHKRIIADGQTYIACGSIVWVNTESSGLVGGETSYLVSFVDQDGNSHSLRGIKKVSVVDLPKMVPKAMPWSLPDTSGVDADGKPFQEGNVYTWADGAEAQFLNGKWVEVMGPNTACRTK